jgi:hypothetical protein
MESFFATLKQERVYHQHYQSRQQAKQDIFKYIEVWYNRKRTPLYPGICKSQEFENNIRQALWLLNLFYPSTKKGETHPQVACYEDWETANAPKVDMTREPITA